MDFFIGKTVRENDITSAKSRKLLVVLDSFLKRARELHFYHYLGRADVRLGGGRVLDPCHCHYWRNFTAGTLLKSIQNLKKN